MPLVSCVVSITGLAACVVYIFFLAYYECSYVILAHTAVQAYIQSQVLIHLYYIICATIDYEQCTRSNFHCEVHSPVLISFRESFKFFLTYSRFSLEQCRNSVLFQICLYVIFSKIFSFITVVQCGELDVKPFDQRIC